MDNPQLQTTLDQAVSEVLAILTGLDLHYIPELDRYRAITYALNRALRANALEHEWSYYSDLEDVGLAYSGLMQLNLRSSVRPRIINDDAVQLQDDSGRTHTWAYWLPRDALHKYRGRRGLWAAHTRSVLHFSRPLYRGEDGLHIMVPVMREPRPFVIPAQLESIESIDPEALPESNGLTSEEVREQLLDFQYPDIVIARAAYMYAQTDPVMQPRVQTLEGAYKDLMYQVIERDDRNTDSPYMNEFVLPLHGEDIPYGRHQHPHSDWKW